VVGVTSGGIVTVGPSVLPGFSGVMMGSVTPPSVVCLTGTLAERRLVGRTNTRLSSGPMPRDLFQALTKVSAGGITTTTGLPTFWPTSAFVRPRSSGATKIDGMPWKLDANSVFVAADQSCEMIVGERSLA
jgi:hypothetical protein